MDSYLGRITKAHIVATVREARGDAAAERIAQLKKGDMADQAQVLMAGSGWLPEPLRTPGRPIAKAKSDEAAPEPDTVAQSDIAEGEPVVAESEGEPETEPMLEAPALIAAE